MKGTFVVFYQPGGNIIHTCYSPCVPRKGEYVDIKDVVWEVIRVTWDIDTLRAYVGLDNASVDEKVSNTEKEIEALYNRKMGIKNDQS